MEEMHCQECDLRMRVIPKNIFEFPEYRGPSRCYRSQYWKKGIHFPKTHDVSFLIELLENAKIVIPAPLQTAKILTDYAVETHYPGKYEPITDEEYEKAAKTAEGLIQWI
ncbi:MAG: HEPN domain-containing protein [Bacillota bacterium]